jgi:2-dehydro-3-deoxyphosphogalactonate aldolase
MNSTTYWQPELPLIAILRGIRAEEAIDHVSALVAAGFDAIEIPLNSPDWQTSIDLAVRHFGARAWIGGGTVLNTADVDTLKALNARLVIAPNSHAEVIRRAVANELIAVPGIATPSEAFAALAAGAHGLKIFPASTYGPHFVQALRAVLPPAPLYAVGGISPDNLADYIAAGCTGAGLGSHLYKPGQPVARTESMARAFIQAFRDATK